MKILNFLLEVAGYFFPPKFDSIRDWNPDLCGETFDGTNYWINLGPEGECGKARPKKYRDGIDRVTQEGI